MFLGYNTNGFAHHRLEDVVDIIAEMGYRGVALTADFNTIDPMAERWSDRARRLDKHLRQRKLRVVVETGARFILDIRRKHQPTLIDPDRHLSLERLHFLQACIRLGSELEAEAVSFWSGTTVDATPSKILMARLVEACLRLCDFAEGRGIKLAFEPEPGMFIDTMDKFAELHGKVNRPNFGLTLDIGHLQCNGELPIGDHIRRWKDWLWNVHIEDMKRGVHDHLMFGEGEIDFPEVMTALKQIDYRRGLYVELSRHSHNAVETAKKSAEFLKALMPSRSGEGKADQVEAQYEPEGEITMQTDIATVDLGVPPADDEPGDAGREKRRDDQVH